MADTTNLNPSSSLYEELVEPFIFSNTPIVDENGNSVKSDSQNTVVLMLILQELRAIRLALASEAI